MAKADFIMGAIAALTLLAGGPALADTSTPSANAGTAYIQAAGATSIPYAALEFCHRDHADCTPAGEAVPDVTLTQALWSQLVAINAFYNAHIVPTTDMDQYRVADLWTYPDSGYGDCEDIQLAKRRALIRHGWPSSALLMTVVRDGNGEGHAVLMVRTDRGDFILDNESGMIERWDHTPYHYLKRQSQADPSRWVDLADTRSNVVVAGR